MTQPAKKIVANDIPQANNIFRLKMLLEKADDHGLITAATLGEMFSEGRDRAYYLAAAQHTLGWAVVAKDGSLNLTAKGQALVGSNDDVFSTSVHADLHAQDAWYKEISLNPTNIAPLSQQLSSTTGMSPVTADRRLNTYVSWYHDLSAGINKNTKKVMQTKRAAMDTSAMHTAYLDMMTGPTNTVASYKETQVRTRTFQSSFRDNLMQLQNKRCAVTGVAMPELLKASHIKPCHACAGNEAVDPYNGLLLDANLDTLFDRGYITFTNNGTMQVSSKVDNATRTHLRLDTLTAMAFVPPSGMQKYLSYHRDNVFKK